MTPTPTEPDIRPRERTERENCPACQNKRLHTEAEKANHPMMGHGYAKEIGGWTHPTLIAENEAAE